MGVLQRTVTETHRVGERGHVQIKGVTGSIRVSGIEGDTATIRIHYRVRAGDQATAERALEQAQVRVERSSNGLLVETPERRLSSGLAWLFGGCRVTAEIEAAIPRGADVSLETVSGSVDAAGFVREGRYRTVSGNVSLWNVSGEADASTVSGSVGVDGEGELSLKATSVSGSIRARAGAFSRLRLSTTSGTIAVTGALAPGGEFRVDSVSGGLDLATPSGLVLDLKTLSGAIRASVQHRLEGGRGQWRAIVGDGAAKIRFNSTSGSAFIRGAADAAASAASAAASAAASGAGGWTRREAMSTPSVAVPIVTGDDAGDASGGAASIENDAVAAASGAGGGTWSAADTDGETEPERPADEAVEAVEAPATGEPDELEILRKVERGEVSVEEAAARLEQIRR